MHAPCAMKGTKAAEGLRKGLFNSIRVRFKYAMVEVGAQRLPHRLGRAILAYVANYPQVDGARAFEDPICDQIEMRLLPKLRGIDVDSAEEAFSKLQKLVEEMRDDPLAEALKSSVDAAREKGQFVWQGVTR